MAKEIDHVKKIPTGISGFDSMLEGGLPEGRVILVTGSAGTGKTVLLNEFLYRGITRYEQNGVFVTFEEEPSDLVKNVGNFGWNYSKLQKEGQLLFVDLSPIGERNEEVSDDYDLSPILLRIREAINSISAKRVVLDGINALFNQLSNQGRVRNAIYQVFRELKEMGVSVMVSVEQPDNGQISSGENVEEFVGDGVIQLRIFPGEQQLIRKMLVTKMRGVGYRSGFVQFIISSGGMRVFPKVAVQKGIAETDFSERKRMGVPGLDRALDGGIPKGHIVLISGTTGSGKTLSCMQFLEEGINSGENGVCVALEEPVQQVKKTGEEHGWNFEKREKEGSLRFVTAELIDPIPDELLADIMEAVDEVGAKRLVVDSISSIMSASMHQENVRQFLLQLANYIKYKGLTSILSFLMSSNFGAEKGQLFSAVETNSMRLSSIVDGVILLQYVERNHKVEKLLNVLKMRGCDHQKDIFTYEIKKGGLRMGGKFRD